MSNDAETRTDEDYQPPQILGVRVAPDLTKCMQNTGGIEASSTFKRYRDVRDSDGKE